MKKLKIGDKVIARFLGEPHKCEVIEIVDKETYRLKSYRGTILPSAKWKKKCQVDKKGKIISPWYIEKFIKQES